MRAGPAGSPRSPVPPPPTRASSRSWLCPTDADVQRFHEALPGINRGRRQVVQILFLSAVTMTPWLGRFNLFVLASAATIGYLSDRLAEARTATMRSGVMISGGFQLMLSASVAATGGTLSPYLPWLVVPVTMLAARYRRVVVIVCIINAVLVGALACVIAAVLDTGVDPPSFVIGLAMIGLVCALGAIALNLQAAELESRRSATSDQLTGLLNRKALDLHWPRMIAETAEGGAWLSVLVCDLDHFKAVNDTHGHAVGDEVLAGAAAVLTECLRPQDLAFRVGGEEFLVLLPDTDLTVGAAIGEAVRATLAGRTIGGLHITMSIGAAAARGAQADPELLTKAADAALYRAKAGGRNRLMTAPTVGRQAASHEDRPTGSKLPN
jgi:diguanylate cyclase (GGDEF)-like protein